MNFKDCYEVKVDYLYEQIYKYRRMIELSDNQYEKMHYEGLINSSIKNINYLKNNFSNQYNQDRNKIIGQNNQEQRVFTLEELSQYDGSNGNPAYVAVNDIVYDVSLESTWGGGTHFSLYAGKDLTNQFSGCHDNQLEVLRNLPKIGVLKRA